MKSFRDYLTEAEYAAENPVVGDLFDLELSPTEIVESEVIDVTEDGIVIQVTESVLSLLEGYASAYNDVNRHTSTDDDDDDFKVREAEDQLAQLRKDAADSLKQSMDKLNKPQPEKSFMAQVGDKIIGGVKGAAKGFAGGTAAVEEEEQTDEAKYQGREVPLGKPMKGDVKKSKVYVKNPKTGKVIKVNFGQKGMKIKKSIPGRRKNFRARHNCANPGPRTKARYWSCRAW